MDILFNDPLVIKKNFKKIFSDISEDMIHHLLKFRRLKSNFQIGNNKNFDLLYNTFLNFIKSSFINYTIKNLEYKYWGCLIDKYFAINSWHNHLTTSTINGVFYLKIDEENENGLAFKINNEIKVYKPKLYDMIVFPNFLEHKPLIPKKLNKTRISINTEVFCREISTDIFNINNLKKKEKHEE